jgi:hypothetical protein
MNNRLALSLFLAASMALGCARADDGAADHSGIAPDGVGASGHPDSGQPDASPAPTAMMYCQGYAAALCAKEAQCDPTGLRVFYGDEAACARSTAEACLVVSVSPDVAWTAEARATCGAELAATTCDDYLTDRGPAACTAPPGLRKPGDYCRYNGQCDDGRCLAPTDSPCGRCVASTPGKPAGSACASSRECDVELVCLAKQCAPASAEGGACANDLDCQGYLVCIAQVCRKSLDAGQPCTRHGECGIWGSCGTAKVCIADTVVGPGQRCGKRPDGSYDICGQGATCDTDKELCVAAASEGSACTGNDECPVSTLCLQQVCRAVEPAMCPVDGGALAAQTPPAGSYQGQTDKHRPVSFVVEATGELRDFQMQVLLTYGQTGCLVTISQAGSAVVVGPRALVPVSGPYVGAQVLALEFTGATASGRLGSVSGGLLSCGDSLTLGTTTTLGGPWTLTATLR